MGAELGSGFEVQVRARWVGDGKKRANNGRVEECREVMAARGIKAEEWCGLFRRDGPKHMRGAEVRWAWTARQAQPDPDPAVLSAAAAPRTGPRKAAKQGRQAETRPLVGGGAQTDCLRMLPQAHSNT